VGSFNILDKKHFFKMKERFTEIKGLDAKGKAEITKRIIDNRYNIKEESDDTGTSFICTKPGRQTHRIYIRKDQNKQ